MERTSVTLKLLNPQDHMLFYKHFRPPSSTDDGKKLRTNRVGPYTFEVRRHPFPIGTSVTIEGIVGNDALVKEIHKRNV